MKYDKFLKKCKDEVNLLKYNFHGSKEIEDRNISLWMVHQTIETNKKLVWATWGLAIGTLILSGLTIYFQFFR